MGSENTENSNLETSQESNFSVDFQLPEVSDQSLDYHDNEILASMKAEEEQDDSAGDASESGEHSPSDSPVESSQIFLEDEREKSRGVLDDKNVAFDPALHVFPPEKTPSGRWKKIPKSQREKKDPETGKTILTADTNLKCKRDADKSAKFYDSIHITVFGKEAKATDEQMLALADSFERFYQENGALNIPPHWDLALTCLDHTTEVVRRPTIWEKVSFYSKVFAAKVYCKFKGIKMVPRGTQDEEQETEAE